MLRRHFGFTAAMMKRFAEEDSTFRELFIAYFRSRASSTGSLTPTINDKHVRKSPTLQKWAQLHGLKPFYVTQLFHTSNVGHRTVCASHVADEDAYFGQVLEIKRCWNIQIEGAMRVWLPGYYRVVWRLKLAHDHLDLGPLHFLSKVVESDPIKTLLMDAERAELSRKELTWDEDELESPITMPGSHTHYIWEFANPEAMQQPDPVALAQHPNDRPFGAPEPAPQPAPIAFGVEAQQELFELRNRLLAQDQVVNNNPHNQRPPQAAADNQGAAQNAEPQDGDMPGLMPAEPDGDDGHFNAPRRNGGPFPVDRWFSLLSGFVQIKNPHDAVCFAITNFAIGYKYGLMVDYVSLVPVTKREYELRDEFNLGPLLMDDNAYWDSLCQQVLLRS